ncbi:MAG: endonuclease domain-containing protein [Candidatus Rokuibacteriota bacterium]
MMMWRKCGHERTIENTCGVSAARPGGTCRLCANAAQARYRRTEKDRAKRARYLRTEKRRAARKRYDTGERGRARHARKDWNRLGVDPAFSMTEYNRLLLAQGNVCALCAKPPHPGKRLDTDHNHATGLVRGALHEKCNWKVGAYEAGRLKPGTELAAKIAAYLKVTHQRDGAWTVDGQAVTR